MAANWLPVHKDIRNVIKKHDDIMLFGGAGSSKTWTILKTIFQRAMLIDGSRHICLRQRFEHVKTTLWPSAKELFVTEWGDKWDLLDTHRSGGVWKISFDNGSEILFGGLDDKERVEKHLGAEYATVYINECSEIQDVNAVELVSSRLRQKIDGRHLLLLDMNPPPKSHWSYERYIESPTANRKAFKINPIDVRENLPDSYIKRLEALPERMRQRFLHGEFTADIDGALWSWDLIQGTRNILSGEIGKTVVAIDPAVTNKESSDETGIIVVAKKGNGAIVLEDLSCKDTPNGWAGRAIAAYYKYEADHITVEVNHGHDLIKTIMRNLDPLVPIKEVRATKGKHIRAEPVVVLYEQGLIEHVRGLTELEDQMMTWVPHDSDSPDRVDAICWALHDLMLDNSPSLSISFI